MTKTKNIPQNFILDDNLHPTDIENIRKLVELSGVFTSTEVDIAKELVEDRLTGKDNDYHFLFLRDSAGSTVAYTCFGPIPLTEQRFDLYWIVVNPNIQGAGLGQTILKETESRVKSMNGSIIYAETSGTDAYLPARNFYVKLGFEETARLKNFYREGDDKVIFEKRL